MADVQVPFLDLAAGYRELQTELDAAYRTVMESGRYLLGDRLAGFEQAFAAYVGAHHGAGVASGLDALTLALRAAGVVAGDDVLVPSHTFIATWLSVTALGARPIPVEPDEGTYVVEPDAVAAAITPRTTAIVPVHLYGLPVDLAGMAAVADRHGVALIPDAAQAHGATVDGRPVGSVGLASAWSFYPGKNLGAFADGGAVTTGDERLADEVRRLRNYGSSAKYVHEERGTNSRLDELQAAALRVKLGVLDEWNARRARVARIYRDQLAALDLTLPSEPPGRVSAWHLFVVRTHRRDDLREHLQKWGVETLIHYPIPPHRQAAYRDLMVTDGPLPVADRISREVLSLPIGPHMTDEQIERTVAAVRSFWS